MDIIRSEKESKNYSLHDSRINKIIYNKGNLTFDLDYIFEYRDGEEVLHRGSVIFESLDMDFCRIFIFNRIVERGRFSGKFYYLKDFIDEFKDKDFQLEIINETYNGYDSNFEGWIWIDNKARSFFMTSWNDGNVIYRIED